MNDTERVIGELKEFKRATLEKLDLIERRVSALDEFKWKVTGAMVFIVAMIEVLGQVARAKAGY